MMGGGAHLAVRAAALLAVAAIALGHDWLLAPQRSGEVALAASEPGVTQLAPLFARQEDAASPPDQLVPVLLGIAGRLPDDAEALVRTPAGGLERLRIGAGSGGWTVVAIAADAVTFEREGVRKVARLKPAE